MVAKVTDFNLLLQTDVKQSRSRKVSRNGNYNKGLMHYTKVHEKLQNCTDFDF
jgi:hypothetical protein